MPDRDAFDVAVEPDLADLLRAWGRSIKLQIRTHVPAKVMAYNPATQTATVEVATLQKVKIADPTKIPKRVLYMTENGEAVLQPLLLAEIPVAWPRTQQGYMTFPLGPGDTGTLHVHDRSLEQWKLLGISADPVLAFLHSLADSEFHPGLHPTTAPIAPPTDMLATVVDGAQVKIGRMATLSIATAEPLIAALDAFANAVPVATDGGAAIHTAFKEAWLIAKPQVAALKGKVE